MIVKPRIRGFLCTTAHPKGCAKYVLDQVNYVKSKPAINGTTKTLIVGCSMGYGLASRISAAFGCGANTIGVSFEKEPTPTKTASPGWYNNEAFGNLAREHGLLSHTINGDAYSDGIKQQVVDIIKEELGTVDLLVYSLASPVRTQSKTGNVFRSFIKPIGQDLNSRTLQLDAINGNCVVRDVHLPAATPDEIESTVAVMGGEDWEDWVATLASANVLSSRFKTVAYTYMGNELTWPIYRGGTIGRAKEHLDLTCQQLNAEYGPNIEPLIAVLKAVVTQASTAIPVVPLYFSILFKEMKKQGTHEDCIQQIHRLFDEQLYRSDRRIDEAGRIRMDNFEMDEVVQQVVKENWHRVDSENVHELADVEGFRQDFLSLFGFERTDIDYDLEVDPTTVSQ
ncbi:MAG: trans-2-enoyl-CoA reductase family protein [Gammaproteobacteria bacterium]|nr:trans-2-enoyl-CoA reductase family protein [Gammaproteobacteria bacterium]